ncbi:DnaJ domain-containing protein [Fodinicurvata sediminis]|uniref:DnaJ domain-containing protein n=1 Tax=Fodinicurvata sediminis TaxID=1121832 RepID=UPI000429D76F|nr:DnaJ domain-containing protein [Fodinicurvata sediminis]
MLGWVILIVCGLAGGYLLLRWFVNASPGRVKTALLWTAALIGTGLMLFALWGGLRQLIALALPFLMPLLFRLPSLLRRMKWPGGGQGPGQVSTVETRFLRMTLDHDTGSMDGVVREGEYRPQRLSEMSHQDLIAFWEEVRIADEESTAVLESYLDRVLGEDWRNQKRGRAAGEDQSHPSNGSEMSLEEAWRILELDPGADETQVRAAHRRLMQKFHPDAEGSNYLASKINQAKDVLLKHLRGKA